MGVNHGSGVPSTSVTPHTIIHLMGTRLSLIKSAATACMRFLKTERRSSLLGSGLRVNDLPK
jgi:hypothetical protein